MFRKILLMALSSAMLFNTIFTEVYAVTVNVENEILNEKFEYSQTAGTALNGIGGWTTQTGNGTAVLLGQDPESPTNKTLKITRETTGSNSSAAKSFEMQSGTVTVSADLYFEEKDNFRGEMLLWAGVGGTQTVNIGFERSQGGTCNVICGLDTSSPLTFTNAFDMDDWFTVKAVIDMTTYTYDFYLDNDKLNTNPIDFINDTAFSEVRIQLNKYYGGQSEMHVDNFKINGTSQVSFDEEDVTLDYTVMPVDYATRKITVTGTSTPYFNQEISVVVKEKTTGNEAVSNTTRVGNNGSFSVELNLDANMSGWYYVVISTEYITTAEADRTEEIYIASSDDIENIGDDFTNISDTVSVATETVRHYINMITTAEGVALFENNSELIAQYFIDSNATYADVQDVSNAFLTFTQLIKAATAQEGEIPQLLGTYTFISSLLDDDYNAVKADVARNFVQLRPQSFDDTVELEKVIKESIALAVINSAGSNGMKSKIEKYNDVLLIDLTDSVANKVNQEKLYSALVNQGFTTTKSVKDKFEAKVRELDEVKDYEYTTVHISKNMISDNFETYAIDENIQDNSDWEAGAMKWQPVIGADPQNTGNQVLMLKRTPTDLPDGTSNIPLYTYTENLMDGPYEISFRVYIPDDIDAGDGTKYNSAGNGSNQAGIVMSSEDGVEIFYSNIDLNTGKVLTFYTGEDGSGKDVQTTLNPNQWYEFEIAMDMENSAFEMSIGGQSLGTFKLRNYATVLKPKLKNIGFYLRRDAVNSLVMIDELVVDANEKISFVQEDMIFDYDVSSVNYESNKFTVNGSVSPYALQEITAVMKKENGSQVYNGTFQTVKAENKGTFEFDVSTLGLDAGWYDLTLGCTYVNTPESSRRTKVYIAGTSETTELVSDFNGITTAVNDVIPVISRYLNVISTYEESQIFAANGAMIAKHFIAEKSKGTTYTKISDVAEIYKQAAQMYRFTTYTSTQLLDTIQEASFVASETGSEDFKNYKNDIILLFTNLRANTEQFYTEDEVKTVLRQSMALAAINDARKGNIKPIVTKYNDVLGLNITSSDALSVDQDLLYAYLYNKNYTALAELQTDFADGLLALKSNNNNNNQPSSGGGGGGGGGATQTIKSTVTPEVPAITPTKISSFSDISGHWAEAQITSLAEKQIVFGYEDGSYGVMNNVTRAEFVAMLCRTMKLADANGNEFSDVSQNQWYAKYVYAAFNAGLVAGDGEFFRPNEYITRQDIVAILARNVNDETATENSAFTDFDEVSDYAKKAVSIMYKNGVIAGYEDGRFAPKAFATRAEISVILDAFMKIYC